MTNKYLGELTDIAERSETDNDAQGLLIAQTMRTLLGTLQAPVSMQDSFSEYLGDFARSALIELEMHINNGKE